MRYLLFAALALSYSLSAGAQALLCDITNPSLEAMPALTVEFVRDDGSAFVVTSKLADNNVTRAAGFQRVCESSIAATPILFDFGQPLIPRFHMNNVVAPIDIAFIDQDGKIESIQSMLPYVLGSNDKPLYGPQRPIVAALEGHKGFFTKHRLNLGSTVSWKLSDVKE